MTQSAVKSCVIGNLMAPAVADIGAVCQATDSASGESIAERNVTERTNSSSVKCGSKNVLFPLVQVTSLPSSPAATLIPAPFDAIDPCGEFGTRFWDMHDDVRREAAFYGKERMGLAEEKRIRKAVGREVKAINRRNKRAGLPAVTWSAKEQLFAARLRAQYLQQEDAERKEEEEEKEKMEELRDLHREEEEFHRQCQGMADADSELGLVYALVGHKTSAIGAYCETRAAAAANDAWERQLEFMGD